MLHSRSVVPMSRYLAWAAGLALLLVGSPAPAQQDAQEWLEECQRDGDRRREVFCEVRELRLDPTGMLEVDASPNGGIRVEGWDRNEVLVRARVRAHAPDAAEARELASQVRVQAAPGVVRTDGPSIRGRGNRGWSVSYDVFVPRRTDLDLESTNGGLRVSDIAGRLELETTNGGISLEGVSGDVRGHTVNGGLDVRLDGSAWEGPGLDLETTNGGITLAMPAGYSARLEARTTNGGLSTDFPITMQGRIGRRVEAELGRGGPPIRLTTVNGGIQLRRR